MGRIAGAFGMGILRGCVVYAFAAVYVLVVTTVFFFLPLGRAVFQPTSDPKQLILPLGLGVFFLLVGPTLLLALAVRRRNAGTDAIFGSLGLAGFPYVFQFRRYEGSFGGRRLQALLSRGPMLVIETETPLATRFGIAARAGDTAFLLDLMGQRLIRLEVPAFEDLLVFGEEESWVRRFLAEPGVPALLSRLLLFPGGFARRQVTLRPGALAVTYHLSRSFFRVPLTAELARSWSEALIELARIAEAVPPPERPLAPTLIESRIDSVRGMGLKVNPGVAVVVVLLAGSLLAGAIAGVAILAGKSCRPRRGPGSTLEGTRIVEDVSGAARVLQISELRPIDVLGVLGTVEREDATALYAAAKSPPGARIVVTREPTTGAGREIEWLFATPPAIRMSYIEKWVGKLDLSPAPDDPNAVIGLATTKPRDGARWPVRVRVRFEGKAGGPITRIAAFREAIPASTSGLPNAGAMPSSLPEPSGPAGSNLLSACPVSFEMAGDLAVGEARSCLCVHGSVGGTVHGSGRYGPASWVCDAASHAGVLTKPGGAVTFYRQPDCPRLWGSEGNGAVSINWGATTATYSFTAEAPPCPPSPRDGPEVQPCPATLQSLVEWPEGKGFDCTCEWSKRRRVSVWGRDIYAIHSDVCSAAQHVGAVKPPGSTVTVFLGGGCSYFAGASNSINFVRSSRWRDADRSIAFRLPYPPCADGRPPIGSAR